MNIGNCPYPDCEGMIALEVPERTPVYELVQCSACKRDVWYRLARVDPEAWTREQFEAEHIIDDVTKSIKPRQRQPSE